MNIGTIVEIDEVQPKMLPEPETRPEPQPVREPERVPVEVASEQEGWSWTTDEFVRQHGGDHSVAYEAAWDEAVRSAVTGDEFGSQAAVRIAEELFRRGARPPHWPLSVEEG